MTENYYSQLKKIKKHPGFYKNPKSRRIYWRGTIRGQALKKSTKTTKISEAKKVIDNFILTLTFDNIDRAQREKKGITNPLVKSLWDEMIKERSATKAESTLYGYSVSWRNKLSPFWGKKNLSDISRNSVTDFENWYLKTYPEQGFFNTRKHLQMLLNYLHREGYIQKKIKIRDLDKDVESRAKKKTAFRVYSDWEEKQLLANAPSLISHVLLTLYFDSGMRKMEAISRKWEDLDLKKKTLKVWSQKNKKWREIPLTERAIKLLEVWQKESPPSEFIFPMKHDQNHPLSARLFYREWMEAKQKAKIEGKARVHDIRHTFATKTAQAGWPVPIACQALDMSAEIYMKTYVHINPSDIGKWMSAFSKN